MTAENEPGSVPRSHKEPTPDDVFEAMVPRRCYVVADLVAEFEDVGVNRWTIQNRLDSLADESRIVRRKHANDRVTYQRPEDADE